MLPTIRTLCMTTALMSPHSQSPHTPSPVALWLQLFFGLAPAVSTLLSQARSYGAYRARLASHWEQLVERDQQQRQQRQQQRQQQQQLYPGSGQGAAAHTHALACVAVPPPNPDEWQYDAAMRGVRVAKRLEPALVACAAAVLLWVGTSGEW